jgi:hypothetical protein
MPRTYSSSFVTRTRLGPSSRRTAKSSSPRQQTTSPKCGSRLSLQPMPPSSAAERPAIWWSAAIGGLPRWRRVVGGRMRPHGGMGVRLRRHLDSSVAIAGWRSVHRRHDDPVCPSCDWSAGRDGQDGTHVRLTPEPSAGNPFWTAWNRIRTLASTSDWAAVCPPYKLSSLAGELGREDSNLVSEPERCSGESGRPSVGASHSSSVRLEPHQDRRTRYGMDTHARSRWTPAGPRSAGQGLPRYRSLC